MPTVEAVSSIDAPLADVVARLHDFAGLPDWVPLTWRVLRVDGPAGVVGTTYVERGPTGRSRWRIVKVEASATRHVEVHEGAMGPARVRLEFRIHADAERGCTVYEQRTITSARWRGWGWAVAVGAWVLAPIVRRIPTNLKHLMES